MKSSNMPSVLETKDRPSHNHKSGDIKILTMKTFCLLSSCCKTHSGLAHWDKEMPKFSLGGTW